MTKSITHKTEHKLDVVLRTCDKVSVHPLPRYCQLSKYDLIVSCVQSLINSLNQVEGDLKLVIYDDHSSATMLGELERRLTKLHHPHEFRHMQEHGHHASNVSQYEYCRNESRELIYTVEDDYLHHPIAIGDMLATYDKFTETVGQPVAISPFNSVEEYYPPLCYRQMILPGPTRFWRTTYMTTASFLTHRQLFDNHWELLHLLASKSGTEGIGEHNTLSHIWIDHVVAFAWITPPLALHLGGDHLLQPYTDWQQWLADYSREPT